MRSLPCPFPSHRATVVAFNLDGYVSDAASSTQWLAGDGSNGSPNSPGDPADPEGLRPFNLAFVEPSTKLAMTWQVDPASWQQVKAFRVTLHAYDGSTWVDVQLPGGSEVVPWGPWVSLETEVASKEGLYYYFTVVAVLAEGVESSPAYSAKTLVNPTGDAKYAPRNVRVGLNPDRAVATWSMLAEQLDGVSEFKVVLLHRAGSGAQWTDVASLPAKPSDGTKAGDGRTLDFFAHFNPVKIDPSASYMVTVYAATSGGGTPSASSPPRSLPRLAAYTPTTLDAAWTDQKRLALGWAIKAELVDDLAAILVRPSRWTGVQFELVADIKITRDSDNSALDANEVAGSLVFQLWTEVDAGPGERFSVEVVPVLWSGEKAAVGAADVLLVDGACKPGTPVGLRKGCMLPARD